MNHVCSSFEFSVKVFGLRGLIVFVASLGDFKTTSCSSGWICFHWTGGFYYMCKTLQEAIQVRQECSQWQAHVKLLYARVCAPVRVSLRGTFRFENVQECVFDHEHVVH